MVGRVFPRMKKLLFGLLLVAGALRAEPTVLDLGARGQLTIYLPDGWKVATTDMAGQMTVNIDPEDDAINANCSLIITMPEKDHFDTKSRLKLRVEADCAPYIEQSVEGKAIAQEFTLTTGFGYYYTFTDPALRGKPAEKGNFKVLSVGKIHLAPDVLMDLSIGSEGIREKSYQQLLGAIEAMEYKRG